MPRIELSLKESYRPKWGFWEGIRELIQNGKDAAVEHSAKFSVTHNGIALQILNEGCTLDRDALLLGETSKAARTDLIGQWGDGLKCGILALVRAGYGVRISTGGEVWTPRLEQSKTFKAAVLTFNIKDGLEYQRRVLVEVTCPKSKWLEIKPRFLFLNEKHSGDIKTRNGTLLGDNRFDGDVFVKGIWVCHDNELQNGYDLAEGKVDIDRKMVEDWDLRWRLAYIMRDVATKSEHSTRVLALVEDESKDVDFLKNCEISPVLVEAAMANFVRRFGENAIPVASTAEAAEIAHIGKIGIVCNELQRKLLGGKLPTLLQLQSSLESKITHRYSFDELEPIERTNFNESIELLKSAGIAFEPNKISVVDFREDCLNGLFADGNIYLRRSNLPNRRQTLSTLIHEISHYCGGDGEISHVQKIEEIWSAVVEYLRSRI